MSELIDENIRIYILVVSSHVVMIASIIFGNGFH